MTTPPRNIGVLTSGGDAPGMNAAVRSVVRTALDQGVKVYAIFEGYQGMVDGGAGIRSVDWDDVSGILHRGGTAIGTARCQDFRTRDGRRRAAEHLIERDISNLVIIGGDGSLTGAHLLQDEWADLLDELATQERISKEVARKYPQLTIVGLVGSIDNDMPGTDTTIGADTALRRITDAVDALSSTAASHQRTFVVEVMGRNCGYLALMGALATGASWAIIPEDPPEPGVWQDEMCSLLKAARAAGRRDTIVLVAEGARDSEGAPITSAEIKAVLEERLGLDTRVTILGHVQRGGAPSAFDRYMSTVLGHAAAERLLSDDADKEPVVIGMRENRIKPVPLSTCLNQSHAIAKAVERGDTETAVRLRGGSFKEALQTFRTLSQALPRPPKPDQERLRIAVLNASGPAPGMNTATRAAVRLGLDQGHIMLGVDRGFRGLVNGDIEEMTWMRVEDWTRMGGSELGTSRKVPRASELYTIARNLEEHEVQALLVIGGWAGYQAAYSLYEHRTDYPAFNLPIICLPASINNNLPGSELSIGADTALNNIVEVVDKIKQSAVASNRAFVVEVMGRYCGYLALMSGFATGAERVYLHEEGVTLRDLQHDVEDLTEGFELGKRLGLIIRNENANPIYSTPFINALFEEEGGDLFTVRQAILGHLQQGGDPSPFDRIQATRLAARCVSFLVEKASQGATDAVFMGLEGGQVRFRDLEFFPRMVDEELQRPKEQWWLQLRPIARILAQTAPSVAPTPEPAPADAV
jgi:6-phosphofructokinase 1